MAMTTRSSINVNARTARGCILGTGFSRMRLRFLNGEIDGEKSGSQPEGAKTKTTLRRKGWSVEEAAT